MSQYTDDCPKLVFPDLGVGDGQDWSVKEVDGARMRA